MENTTFDSSSKYKPVFDSDRLSHAYIISGDELRYDFAETLAAAVLCSESGKIPCGKCKNCVKKIKNIHPDFRLVEKDKDSSTIKIKKIREDVVADSFILPNEASKKVYLINDAELMEPITQNTLLKVLEEPPSYVVIILVTENISEIIPTVRSRCVNINLSHENEELPEESVLYAKQFLDSADKGEFSLASFSFEMSDLKKEEFENFVIATHFEISNRIKSLVSMGEIRKINKLLYIDEVLNEAMRYYELNVNLTHIVGYICAKIVGNED